MTKPKFCLLIKDLPRFRKTNSQQNGFKFFLDKQIEYTVHKSPHDTIGNQVFNHIAMKDHNQPMEELWRFISYRCCVPMSPACL
ncbi:protein of unknown function [Methylocaldum szegediense]|uniref:Uncharacterized protein n=1 Tax=Methylocaldum szegediense TaxID=73780 RepID=A0ABN8X5M5_9GAMM|nr:protein of unknown function [Methylocaldum szegediense]